MVQGKLKTKIRIVIFGSAGMLGHMIYHYLIETGRYEVYTSSFPYQYPSNSTIIDVTNKEEVEKFLVYIKPDIVVNCIGMLIRASTANPASAIYINAWFPHHLSAIMKKVGGHIIQISTDCVFSGSRGNYHEFDKYDVNDIYGMSKALGELINESDLTIRTSIIGPELNSQGEGLFQWFMNQKGMIKGFTKVFWSGVTTLELARAIDEAIKQDLRGLYNLASEKISKYQLLCLIQDVWQRKDVTIEPDNEKVVDKSLLTLRYDFDFRIKSYPEMLNDLYYFMKDHCNLYYKSEY